MWPHQSFFHLDLCDHCYRKISSNQEDDKTPTTINFFLDQVWYIPPEQLHIPLEPWTNNHIVLCKLHANPVILPETGGSITRYKKWPLTGQKKKLGQKQ